MYQEKEDIFVKDVYDKIAPHFDLTRAYQWKWVTDFTDQYSAAHTIIDIGCGNGRNMSKNTIGVDNCEAFVEMCKSRGHRAIKADMTDIPLPDHCADAIISIASFHHLTTKERRLQSLKEMVRLLKPNTGKILLSVWSQDQPKKTRRTFHYGANLVPWNKDGVIYERYYYIFTMDELNELFQDANLSIIDHTWDCGNEVFTLAPNKL